MKLESVFLMVFLIILVVSSFTALGVSRVETFGTVYIRADGSIDPTDAPISTVDNVTYTLTGNITTDADGIVVERDNIVVDGSGSRVEGTHAYLSHGMFLDGRSNVTIRNTNIGNFDYGIWLNSSSNNSIDGNNITNNWDGISLRYSSNNSISGNNITNNGDYGIELGSSSDHNSISGNNITSDYSGIWLVSSNYNNLSGNTFTGSGLDIHYSYWSSVENNTVNGKPLVCLEGVADYSVGDAGQVILVRCDRIRVENLSLYETSTGVRLWETNNSIISGNKITNNGNGIELDYSSNNSIGGNKIANNSFDGIGLYISSNNNSINGNNITDNGYLGIWLGHSSNYNRINGNNITGNGDYGINFEFSSNYNSIDKNNITNESFGVYLSRSSNNNSISENNIKNNVRGVYLHDSYFNVFYHNNFVNNTYVVSEPNFWDNGCEGNYWSDYNGTDLLNGLYQNETGSDNIGDTSYIIDANNTDNYPLVRPYVPFENQTIYFRADGSIDPSGAPILRRGDLYLLTGNITSDTDGIVVERDNIVIDGARYAVQGKESGTGTTLSGRSNVTIKNMEIRGFYDGIYLYNSSNSVVSGNNVTSNYRGIHFLSSQGNTVSGNNVTYNDYAGVPFYSSSFNIVSGNSITNSYRGVELWQSSSNIVSGNNIVNNTGANNNGYGIYIASSSGNSFYHNNFVNNTKQAYDYGLDDPHTPPSSNVWDNGYPSGGNYWNDYVGMDADFDGIGDIPYNIDVYSEDNHPLMGMFYDFEVVRGGNEKYHVQVVSNSTVSELYLLVWLSSPNQYLQPGQEFLQLSVEGENYTCGFCRVTIPRALLNGTYTVLVDWTELPAHELTASDTTHAYLYFAYNHTKHEITIIPEFPSFLILPLFCMATLFAVITYRRRHR